MDRKFKWGIVIWLIILSIISLAALARSFHRDIDLGIDYIGIIVGILAALCTVLIGWQIYSFFDYNKREKKNEQNIFKLRDILKMHTENNNRGDYLLYDNLSEVYEIIASQDGNRAKYERILHKIKALNYAARINEFETCELGIKILELFISKNDIIVKETEKERLIKFACSIPNQEQIKNFADLINAITAIKS